MRSAVLKAQIFLASQRMRVRTLANVERVLWFCTLRDIVCSTSLFNDLIDQA